MRSDFFSVHPVIDWLLNIASGVGGYLGIFVVSILGNFIPFIPIPYLVAVYLYAALIPGSNPLLVGIISGVGGGVGKLIVYLVSRGASRVVLSEDTRERYNKLSKMLGNWGMLAVFLFAATPSPDDAIVIPLGLMGYSPLKFFIGITAGKILISIVTAYSGRIVAHMTGGMFWYELLVSIVLFIAVMLIISLLDWEGILTLLGEKGLKGLRDEISKKGLGVLLARRNK
ncbi:MAG: VTT domain-containing protein [Infirmifilum sp.]|uniref:VTT domain-containing protein n=1 Tax=Infirmifilum TaxID=2856573 RepID=UPI003C713742